MSVTAACGGGSGGSSTPSTGSGTPAAAPKKDVTISFIHWRGEDTEVFKTLIAKFEKENPGIKVQMDIFPSEQYQSTAQSKLLDGTTGDVFTSFPGAQFEAIAKAGLYEDLSKDKFVELYNKNLIKAGQKDGKQLALPSQLVFNMPVYNVGMFEKLGIKPPSDWKGFLEMCDKIAKAGIIPIAFPGADIGPGQFMNTMMMNNTTDEEIFQKLEAGQAKLTDEWWVTTLKQFKELNDKGYLQKDSLGTKADGAIALFAQQKAAMIATGSYHIAGILKQEPTLKLDLLAPITVAADKKTFDGIHTATFMYGVNARSKVKAEAKKFVEFLSKKENATDYANGTSQFVTVTGAEYKAAELKALTPWLEKKTRFQPRYFIVNAEVQKAVTGSIQAVIGGKDPAEAAKEAQAIVDRNIKK